MEIKKKFEGSEKLRVNQLGPGESEKATVGHSTGAVQINGETAQWQKELIDQSRKIQHCVQQGEMLVNSGNYEQALALFEQTLSELGQCVGQAVGAAGGNKVFENLYQRINETRSALGLQVQSSACRNQEVESRLTVSRPVAKDFNCAVVNKKQQYIVTLLGYSIPGHTNWYPWKIFHRVFTELGYLCEWVEAEQIDLTSSQRRIYICWNVPDAKTLLSLDKVRPGDVILQKLTSLGKGYGHVNWGNDPLEFFRNWTWPIYKAVEDLYDSGVNIYAFGCRTNTELFPEKHRICEKLKDRIHWIPWGSSLYTWEEIQNAKPAMDSFCYDIGFVGSIWGTVGRGNIDGVEDYLVPLMRGRKCMLAGRGTERGPVDDDTHKEILRRSKLCPIINAASWRAEKGIQDRFWTVFTTGRFGVVDTEGVYDFFDEDEVVCETDPGEYVEKSLYFL